MADPLYLVGQWFNDSLAHLPSPHNHPPPALPQVHCKSQGVHVLLRTPLHVANVLK